MLDCRSLCAALIKVLQAQGMQSAEVAVQGCRALRKLAAHGTTVTNQALLVSAGSCEGAVRYKNYTCDVGDEANLCSEL